MQIEILDAKEANFDLILTIDWTQYLYKYKIVFCFVLS